MGLLFKTSAECRPCSTDTDTRSRRPLRVQAHAFPLIAALLVAALRQHLLGTHPPDGLTSPAHAALGQRSEAFAGRRIPAHWQRPAARPAGRVAVSAGDNPARDRQSLVQQLVQHFRPARFRSAFCWVCRCEPSDCRSGGCGFEPRQRRFQKPRKTPCFPGFFRLLTPEGRFWPWRCFRHCLPGFDML